MKTYFINVDYHGPGFNKFAYTIVQADLTKTRLCDVAKSVIKEGCEALNVSVDEVSINVKAFNEIEVI